MRYERDKDFAWVITFVSFMVFLLAAITSAAVTKTPADLPEAIVLANAHLNRAFMAVLASFVRYAAVAGLAYGIIGVITWPPGRS